MNTLQIDKILRRNQTTSPFYLGCFSSDQLVRNSKNFPQSLVVNFDPSWQEGSHWVAIFAESPISVDYYDSLGIWPPLNENISQFLSNFKHVHFNPCAFQGIKSKKCGKHAIFFIFNRSNGKSFDQILHFLTRGKDHISPDKIVENFIKEKIFQE